MAQTLGVGGSLTFATATINVKEWSGTITNELQDVSDSASVVGGVPWVQRISGFNSAEFTVTAFWGGSAATLSTTLKPGTSGTAVFNVGTSGTSFSVPVIVGEIGVKNDVKAPVEFTCKLTSNGAVTYPT